MTVLSPLDGRYADKTAVLLPFFSEEALNRARLEVEVRYFIALSKEKTISDLPAISQKDEKALLSIIEKFSEKEAQKVKSIEATTNHDVKAVEYYLKKKMKNIKGVQPYSEFVHFGLTSEDVNNLAYGMLLMRALQKVIIPTCQETVALLKKQARQWKGVVLLSLTHGQPATPTTVEKEILVFVERLERQMKHVKQFSMQAKFGGAVGTYSAHKAAYPLVQWEDFGRRFIKSLGFQQALRYTTQINPHDDVAEISHIVCRINTIGIDLSRDIWSYISRGVFKQRVIKGEVGSSTMPHKVNPIDFENAEGNFGLSSALFSHFAEKLPISRLQRDLSDSTVQRSIGVAFGYHHLALQSLQKGLLKLSLNKEAIAAELAEHPEVHAEAIQMVLRKHKVKGAYEQLKEVTRGASVTVQDLQDFVQSTDLPEKEKKRLMKMMKQ